MRTYNHMNICVVLDLEISWNESIHEASCFQADPNAVWKAWAHRETRPAILSPVSRQVACQLRVTQSGRPEEHMVRGAPQYPRVPHAPFQINTRVHLARRDPPSAQTEQAENKCRSPKQINLRAIQNARDGSAGEEKIRFILAKGKHGDKALNIWGDPWNGEVSQSV